MNTEPKTTRVVHCKSAQYETYIGRPSRWGNPYTHRKSGTKAEVVVRSRDEAIARYKDHIIEQIRKDPSMREAFDREIVGKTLGCWCKPLSCHGDVLAELAEAVSRGEDPFSATQPGDNEIEDNTPRRSGPSPID